jgi:hypothetical protein
MEDWGSIPYRGSNGIFLFDITFPTSYSMGAGGKERRA